MEEIKIRIYPEKRIKEQGDLFGLFFEDLNHAADGGLYAELVQNRSFEFDHTDNAGYHGMTAWEIVEGEKSIALGTVETQSPLHEKNSHYLRLEVPKAEAGNAAGIRNLGFGDGIPAEQGKKYRFSCYYRRRSGKPVKVLVALENKDRSCTYGRGSFEAEQKKWNYVELELAASQTDAQARLSLTVEESADLDFDMISLFPRDTFKGRKNGLRRDIAELLREMKPSFLRFPGGCLTHIGSLDGETKTGIYRFANTLGPVEQRPARRNSWGYNQTLGLGYFEFFQFCEDIGAQPLPVMAGGYDPHFLRMADKEQLEDWVQEALGIIEFANGDGNTGWGKVRADMGHPSPFGLKYLGIGNEEVGEEFYLRYRYLAGRIKAVHPEIMLIGSAGAFCSGSEYQLGWKTAEQTKTAYVDEHFYQSPQWFLANADRYAAYPNRSAKVFLGEYASHENRWENALAEAAFMIGMEKAQALGMACYAPMLCHVDYQNWHANMIFFDNHRCFGTANYYVQKLFMNYQGKELVETKDDLADSPADSSAELPLLGGRLAFRTERARVALSDIVFRNLENGWEQRFPDAELSAENCRIECGNADSSHYEVTFVFERKSGRLRTDLDGRDSFSLEFAKADEGNLIKWVLAGWQRMTMLQGMSENLPCSEEAYQLKLELHREYHARLVVDGSHVTTFVDGQIVCDYCFKLPIPKAIYYSAVRNGQELYIKVANPDHAKKKLALQIEKAADGMAKWICFENIELTAQNSFEEPEKVVPHEKEVAVKNGCLYYECKPCSLGVFLVRLEDERDK